METFLRVQVAYKSLGVVFGLIQAFAQNQLKTSLQSNADHDIVAQNTDLYCRYRSGRSRHVSVVDGKGTSVWIFGNYIT